MPLSAPGASVLPSSQLAELSIWPKNSQPVSSNAATLVRKKKSLRTRKMTKKSQLSWVCSAENTIEVESITDKEERDKVKNTINGVVKTITSATAAKLTELSVQSSLLLS